MTHHELCLLAAKWLHGTHNKPWNPKWIEADGRMPIQPCCKWVAVELVTLGVCVPDVFGWGDGTGTGFAGVQIEVKMSHSDFLADRKKTIAEHPEQDLGQLKYYCCPEGVISPDEIPHWCGLLYEKEGVLELIQPARERPDKSPAFEAPFIASVMRRLGVKGQVFDFRKRKAYARPVTKIQRTNSRNMRFEEPKIL